MKYLFLIIVSIIVLSCSNQKSQPDDESKVSNSQVDEFALNDTTFNFLWWETRYDPSKQDSNHSISLNQEYLNNMTDQEKAAIGYLATFIGNECWWDGEANEDRSNLDCTIISALGLGYQCSDTHLGYLRKWFLNDEKVLSELQKTTCPPYPTRLLDRVPLRTFK